MFYLNNREEEFQEKLTVTKLIELKKYTYKKKIVKINDEFINPDEYSTTFIEDGDDVKILHLLAGG
ncbi:sulfur carrier protein ThiS [Mycoplasmatota bacterium]|nr:sulfur carrier protein ThiS [Mycoplasmatota bacterium]